MPAASQISDTCAQSLRGRIRMGRGSEICSCPCALRCFSPLAPPKNNLNLPTATLQVTHSVSVVSSAVDQGALTPLDAAARLTALAADAAYTSLPPGHAARADVMATMSKLAAEGGAGAGGAAKAVAMCALAAVYRVQVGGGLHIKPLALLLTGISIQALGEVDADRKQEGRRAKLKELLDQLRVALRDCEGLQGGEGALVFIAKKLYGQVSDKMRLRRECLLSFLPLLKAQQALAVEHDHNFLQVEKAHADC